MPQIDDALQLQAGTALIPGRPADDALLGLLASMACSDGEVHDDELAFLSKLRTDLDAASLRAWALQHEGPVDPVAIASVVTRPDEQWKTLRFAARMAWKDGELAPEERDVLDALAGAMAMPEGAVDRVLHEMAPDTGERYQADRLLKTMVDIHWDAVQLAGGGLVSEDLCAVLPDGNKVVARVGLDKVEVMAVCTGGVVGRFQEGAAFIGWGELVTYTRSFGLGSAITLHTEDGRAYTLVDSRLTGLGTLLDRLLGSRRPAGEAPKVEARRGET